MGNVHNPINEKYQIAHLLEEIRAEAQARKQEEALAKQEETTEDDNLPL